MSRVRWRFVSDSGLEKVFYRRADVALISWKRDLGGIRASSSFTRFFQKTCNEKY